MYILPNVFSDALQPTPLTVSSQGSTPSLFICTACSRFHEVGFYCFEQHPWLALTFQTINLNTPDQESFVGRSFADAV